MKKKKVCIITGSRAEYGLLYWLMKAIEESKKLELQIIVTGMHLSDEFGNTYLQIEKDGFNIDKKVDISITSDSEIAISKSMSIGIIGFARAYDELNPDLIIVLGDRFEIFSAVTAATISRIPIAHLHGGELTEGAIDEAFRHSITKMSHLHFVATEDYRNRVVQLGEDPQKVFNVGGLGIDNIFKLDLLSKRDFEKEVNFKLGNRNLLVTFHPVTLEKSTSKIHFQNLLNSLDLLTNTKIIFTKANSDIDGRIINKMIDQYVSKNENSIAFKSMGQINYLSALQFIDAVVGNSSSGLLEAPSFKIGTINIGDRQKGRIEAESVISCDSNTLSINKALIRIYSEEFQNTIKNSTNPYGNGGSADQILRIIENIDFYNIIKKSFYDIKNIN